MATKKQNHKGVQAIKRFIAICWDTIDRELLLDLLREKKPNNVWTLKGDRIEGLCPFHPDSNPSFQVDFRKKKIICRGAGCDYNKYQPNLLLFIKDLLKLDFKNAQKVLTGRLGVTNISQDHVNENEIFLQKQNDYKTYQRICNCKLDEMLNSTSAYNDPKNSAYVPYANYVKERGIYKNIAQLPIGLFVPSSELSEHLDQVTYLRISELLSKYQNHMHKVSTFYQNIEGFITHVQVREYDRTVRPQNLLFAPEIGPGFLCIDMLANMHQAPNEIFVTEGDFDCLSYYNYVLNDDRATPYFLVATGGNIGGSLDVLSKLLKEDTGSINLMFDHPNQRGDDLIRSYKQVTRGGNYNIFDWRNPNLPDTINTKKDVDEIIQTSDPKLGWKFVHNCFHNRVKYFIDIFKWFALDVKQQIEKLSDDQNTVYNQLKIIRRQLKYFTTGTQHSIFTKTVEKETGITCQHLTVPSVIGDPDKDQFLADLKNLLEEDMTFFAKRSNKFCYKNNTTKMIRECTSNQLDLENKLNIDLGPWSSWLQSRMAIPEFLKIKRIAGNGVTEYHDPLELNKQITKYVHHVIQLILKTLPEEDTFIALSHGLHFDPDTQKVFLMNGPDVFIGEEGAVPDHSLGTTTKWLPVEEPIYDKYFFRNEYAKWNPFIPNIKVVNHDMEEDFKWAYETALKMMQCWNFKDSMDPEYLAALTLVMEIQQMFDTMTRLHIGGEKSSGKSKLLNLWTGESDSNLKLFYNTLNFSVASEAGWRQDISNKLGTCVMDEFECNPSSPNYKAYTTILTAMRNLGRTNEITKGQVNPDNSLVKGTKPVVYRLRFPMIIASISPIINESGADSQRFLTIEMKHTENWHSPLALIRSKVPMEDIERLRHFINVTIYKYVHAIYNQYKDIVDLGYKDHWYSKATNRTADLIYPAATIWKIIGLDPKEMFLKYLAQKDKTMRQGLGKPQYETIYCGVMDTRQDFIIDADHNKLRMTPWAALSEPNYRAFFNLSMTGLFYQPLEKDGVINHYLMVHWRTIFSNVSIKNSKTTLTIDTIVGTANRYMSRVMDPEEAKPFIKQYAPNFATMTDDITVYNINDRFAGITASDVNKINKERISPDDIQP